MGSNIIALYDYPQQFGCPSMRWPAKMREAGGAKNPKNPNQGTTSELRSNCSRRQRCLGICYYIYPMIPITPYGQDTMCSWKCYQVEVAVAIATANSHGGRTQAARCRAAWANAPQHQRCTRLSSTLVFFFL